MTVTNSTPSCRDRWIVLGCITVTTLLVGGLAFSFLKQRTQIAASRLSDL